MKSCWFIDVILMIKMMLVW